MPDREALLASGGVVSARAALAAGLTAAAALLLAAPGAQAKFGFVTKWGHHGSGAGQFNYARGVTADRAGHLYVADSSGNDMDRNHRIQKFTSTGGFLGKWGSPGFGIGKFGYEEPADVATDAVGNVYVPAGGAIQKFTSTGKFIAKWGTFGDDPGQFQGPEGIATDRAGNVYVADTENYRIQKFTSNGKFLTMWREANGDDLFLPESIAIDRAGYVYVGDTGGIYRFTANGSFILEFEGTHDSGGIDVDPEGNVYVSSFLDDHIQKFTSKGRLLRTWGTHGSRKGQFSFPHGVATDAAGNVYVSDTGNDRIQKFGAIPVVEITKGPESPTAHRGAAFRFRSDEPGAKFRCKLDDGDWKPCSSPHRVRGLGIGKHVFRVRGRVAGNAGKPARWGWKIVR